MILRGHIVQLRQDNGSYDIAGFFAERHAAEVWEFNYHLGAGMVYGDTRPMTRILPGFRIDFEGNAHLHQLQ